MTPPDATPPSTPELSPAPAPPLKEAGPANRQRVNQAIAAELTKAEQIAAVAQKAEKGVST